jgi:hypothetical protein
MNQTYLFVDLDIESCMCEPSCCGDSSDTGA